MHQSFLPHSGILNKSIICVVFIAMCMNVAKEPFHLSLKYTFFYIFAHIFLNHVPHMTQDICWKINKFCNLVQFWYVIISMMSFYSLTATHLKIMVPGIRGPVGGPCKSENITGWGLIAGQKVYQALLCLLADMRFAWFMHCLPIKLIDQQVWVCLQSEAVFLQLLSYAYLREQE